MVEEEEVDDDVVDDDETAVDESEEVEGKEDEEEDEGLKEEETELSWSAQPTTHNVEANRKTLRSDFVFINFILSRKNRKGDTKATEK